MADLKISALPASSTPLAGTEILPIVQSATTKQVSVANLTAGRAVSALSLTSTNDATLSGLTVGRGGGADATNTAVGSGALAATNTGGGNTGIGVNALNANLGGIGNTASGLNALVGNTSGNYNVASGYLALSGNLSGGNNVGIGYSALSTGTANSNNVGIGFEALKVTSGSTNTAIGYQSGIAMTTGTKNVILGSYSGNTGTLDIRINNNNIVLSDGDGNVRAWWDNATARFFGTLLVTGLTNSALTSGRVTYAGTSGVLQDSANLLYSGGDLTVYGINVGRGASAVATNTVLGASALAANTSGTLNTAIGYNALLVNTSGSANVAVGSQALKANLTGGDNTIVGRDAALKNTSGASNTALGQQALQENLSGSNNVAIGSTALQNNTASNNTALGFEAGYTNSTGAKNVFIGQQAGKVSTGNFNTIIGNEAGLSLTTGTCNTFVGGYNNTVGGSGELVTSGSKNTILGVFTGNQGGLDIRTASNYIVLSDGDGNPRQIIDSSGNLGLGVTPSAWGTYKALQGGSGSAIGFRNDGNPITLYTANLYVDGTNYKYISGSSFYGVLYTQDATTGKHTWQTAPSSTGTATGLTQFMTLDASGNLLVGPTSTYAACAGKLNVLNSSGSTAIPTIAVLNPDATAAFVAFSDTATIYGSITRAASAVLYNTTSDQRLKTNIVDAPVGNIDSIKVRSFDWTADGSHQEYGMVAQELLEVAPYAVHQPENPDDMMQVDYSKLVPMMVKEIQDLKARLLTLENK